MLAKVTLVIHEYLELQASRFAEVARLGELLHDGRHATDNAVVLEGHPRLLTKRVDADRITIIQEFPEHLVSRRVQILPKAQRVKVQRVHFSHRIASALRGGYPQQRTSSGDGELRQLLAKVLERGNRPRAGLYLVKDEQR